MSSAAAPGDGSAPASDGPDPRWGTADVEAIVAAIERATPRFEDLRDCPHVPDDVNSADHLLPAPPMTERQAASNDHALPGFGEPTPICGEFIPEAMYVCEECGEVHEKRHICKRRDCPQHAPHGIRELLLGVDGAIGMAAKFGGLLGLLDSSRDHSQVPRTLFFSPPPGWVTESTKPLQRNLDLVGELMSLLAEEPGADFLDGDGLQGRVSYHPNRGEHEEEGQDDRGEWKHRLFKERDWLDDVALELNTEPHFHVRAVGYADVKSSRVVDVAALEAGREEFVERVAVKGVDYELVAGELVEIPAALEEGEAVMSVTEIVEERTGWSIHLQEDDAGRSMSHENPHQQRVKIAAALAYDISHALVYTDSDGKRRIASRWKGADVNRVTYSDYEEQHTAAVYEACIDTLGIDPPDMECHAPDVETRLDEGEWSFSRARSSSAANSSTSSSSGGTSTGGAGGRSTPLASTPGLETTTEAGECGGDLVWIGDVDAAFVVALEAEGVDTSDLERAHQSYVRYMENNPKRGDRPPPDDDPPDLHI